MSEILMAGQLVLMIIAIGSMLVTAGKLLEKLATTNTTLQKLVALVDSLDKRVDAHDTELALLRQIVVQSDTPVHLHRRHDD